jgi:hypothetical protein
MGVDWLSAATPLRLPDADLVLFQDEFAIFTAKDPTSET